MGESSDERLRSDGKGRRGTHGVRGGSGKSIGGGSTLRNRKRHTMRRYIKVEKKRALTPRRPVARRRPDGKSRTGIPRFFAFLLIESLETLWGPVLKRIGSLFCVELKDSVRAEGTAEPVGDLPCSATTTQAGIVFFWFDARPVSSRLVNKR